MEESGENPFADPSIARAATGYGSNGTTQSHGQSLMRDYNPFDAAGNAQTQRTTSQASRPDPLEAYNPFDKEPGAAGRGASMASGVGAFGAQKPAADPPPPYAQSPAQAIDTDSYMSAKRDLDRKARELEEREQRMREEEQRIRDASRQGPAGPPSSFNNWPPLPRWFPLKPCFYQDIDVEIPSGLQHLVKQMYYIWLYHFVMLFLNVLGTLALLCVNADTGQAFGLALLYLVLFTPCSFACWFRPVYKAFRSDSSLNFMIFFFVFAAQACVSVMQALGILSTGMCGLFDGIKVMRGDNPNITVGIICIVIGVLFAFQAIVDFFMLIRIHRLYRSKDGVSMSQAKKDAISTLMKNKDVRDTVVDVGVAAASSGR